MSSPTFIFEGPDGVNMDGLLSDSNDSTSSSTENGLTGNHSLSQSLGHHPIHQMVSQTSSSLFQPHHSYQQTANNHNLHLNLNSGVEQQQHHHQQEKRKLDDLTSSDNKNSNESSGQNTNGNNNNSSTKKSSPPNGKKTKGRVKIKMEFIDNKLRRYTTFSKRKTGIMKKAYELSTLTGTQVMLLVASETGHVYTFATRKLQPMITSDAGKALIQTCLNSPDISNGNGDQRMSATGFEETDLTYTVNEENSSEKSSPSNGFISIPTLFVDQQQQQPQPTAGHSSSFPRVANDGNHSATGGT